MKFVCCLLLACLALTLSVSEASPIQMVQVAPPADKAVVAAARQQVVSAPAAAAAAGGDDDDDDDDDDDIEDALDDDDDDDDDEDEPATGNQAAASSTSDDEEEDDDYIERFFDDILGDEEDDDDDDVSPSTGAVQNPVSAPASAVAAPSASSAEEAIAADYPIGEAGDSAAYDEETGSVVAIEDGIQVIDTAPGDAVKEPAAAASSALASSVVDTPVAQLASNSVSSSATSASDDDDDEEEEDDITDALDDDDEDEDEEETEADAEEEEDDDVDDLIGEDVIEARALTTATTPGANSSTPSATAPNAVPDILINKYNRFVDGIFGRINSILKRSYDPVNVRLTTTTTTTTGATKADNSTATAAASTTAGAGHHTTTAHKAKRRTNGGHKKRKSAKPKSSTGAVHNVARQRSTSDDTAQSIALAAPSDAATVHQVVPENRANTIQSSKSKAQQLKLKPKQQKIAATKPKPKQTATPVTAAAPPSALIPSSANTTTTTTTSNKVQRARGVLYGLSTLQRQGNVRVNVLADHTTVRSNFRLGPLQLRVEKAFGRGAKREVKSATATTTEMAGRITLRIVNGAATLHSIKVQQPRQVQVVSADNHDRTREFVWRKSAHLADVVSEQLTQAARSMLEPSPLEFAVDNKKKEEEDAVAQTANGVTKTTTTQVEIVRGGDDTEHHVDDGAGAQSE